MMECWCARVRGCVCVMKSATRLTPKSTAQAYIYTAHWCAIASCMCFIAHDYEEGWLQGLYGLDDGGQKEDTQRNTLIARARFLSHTRLFSPTCAEAQYCPHFHICIHHMMMI